MRNWNVWGKNHGWGWGSGTAAHRRGAAARNLLECAALVLLAFCLNSGGLALRTQEQLAGKLIRLHVLANSDAPTDQALKLRVRDAVLDQAAALLEGVEDRADAEERLRGALAELADTAAAVLSENGCDSPVTAELRRTRFPTRAYGDFSLPAGQYMALRIVIGAGKGQNWWCVLFPPLCGNAAVSVSSALPAFSTEEIRLITEEDAGYVLKFKVVEWWEELTLLLDSYR